jgi:hypothetical protein
MSLSSILAFVVAGVAAKAKSVQIARRSEDKTDPRFIAGYDAGLKDGKLEAKERIAELEDAIATANAQARRDQELIDLWRERALATPARQVVEFRPPQSALQQQAAALQQVAHLHQMMANQAQNAQYQAMQLGAQGLIDTGLWCNCVPSRTQVWAADRGE